MCLNHNHRNCEDTILYKIVIRRKHNVFKQGTFRLFFKNKKIMPGKTQFGKELAVFAGI